MASDENVYDLYKRLRNELRTLELAPSLYALWSWHQHLDLGVGLRADLDVPYSIRAAPPGPEKGIYLWELALLAKLLIAEAPANGARDLRSWRWFSAAINNLKQLDNAISERYETVFRAQVLVELYRSAHHQFGWQRQATQINEIARYSKIFGSSELARHVAEATGVGPKQLYAIGLSMAGHFSDEFVLPAPIIVSLPSVSDEAVQQFVALVSQDLHDAVAECAASQSFDEDFIYSFNPLVARPLVRMVAAGRAGYVAPVPRFLIRRFTEGIYYDLLGRPGFDAAFGDAFQAYVGDVAKTSLKGSDVTVLPEAEYRVGKNSKRSVDWIVVDATADLFVECKTKRIRLEAKLALSNLEPLERELSKLAGFVAQTYKTLRDALEGRYEHWKPSGRPVYPVIVTLEDWYIFGNRLVDRLAVRIEAELAREGVDGSIAATHPWTVCAAADFERLLGVVAQLGVRRVMEEKTNQRRAMWLVSSALREAFPEEFGRTRRLLFPEEIERLTGEEPPS